MKKFYEKSEIWFAVAAIIVYVILAGNARGNFGDESAVMLLVLAVMTAVISLFIVRNGLGEKYGLTFWPKGRGYLFFIPLFLLALPNVCLGLRMRYAPLNQLMAVLSMALVGYVEEVIFRGFLFRAIEKESRRRAIIISAVTFGVGHIVNLLTGSASLDTILQMAYAVAIGFAFVLTFDRTGSLWPCIAAHSLIDVTSRFANDESALAEVMNIPFSLFLIVVSTAYSVYIVKKFPKN